MCLEIPTSKCIELAQMIPEQTKNIFFGNVFLLVENGDFLKEIENPQDRDEALPVDVFQPFDLRLEPVMAGFHKRLISIRIGEIGTCRLDVVGAETVDERVIDVARLIEIIAFPGPEDIDENPGTRLLRGLTQARERDVKGKPGYRDRQRRETKVNDINRGDGQGSNQERHPPKLLIAEMGWGS